MAKVETEEKRIARRMREQKELAKWKKSRPVLSGRLTCSI